MITLINGGIQDASGIFVPNGSISFQLNVDATVVANPFGFVCADIPIVFQFDENGDILPNAPDAAAQLYSNAELNPQLSDILLGTYYLVTLYDQNGARLNKVPMWWQFPESAGATVDISQMVPVSTVGGNVIFYPTAFTIPPPSPTTLGGVFSNAGGAGLFITSINTDGTVSFGSPSSTGGITTISSKSANFNAAPATMYLVTTGTSAITAQLPTAVGIAKAIIIFKKVDSPVGTVAIGTTSVQTIDGQTSYVLSNQWQYVELISDGANWQIVSAN